MATVKMAVTDEAKDVVTTLALAQDTKYTLQNVGGRNIRLFEGTADQRTAAGGAGHTLHHAGRGKYIIQPRNSVPIWLWCSSGHKSVIVATESVE